MGIFGFSIFGMCLFWLLGDAKRKQQIIANMLIYLLGFMLLGLVVGHQLSHSRKKSPTSEGSLSQVGPRLSK